MWRDYLTVHYLHSRASYLPHDVEAANFAFYGLVLGGQKQQLPRDLRGVQLLDEMMGEELGKIYVARYFPPEAKAKIRQLVDNLLKAYAADIRTLTWMSPATRNKALEKIQHFTVKVGYPDKWRDYSALDIRPGELVADVTRAEVFEWNRELHRIDQPVDRSEWEMTPPTNNAYHSDQMNEIVFPAGILQPPFFDPAADDAVNYGEIGATIGHEISHGFDDQEVSTMPRAAGTIGGPRRTAPSSRPARRHWRSSSTSTSRCPVSMSTASSRWARISRTWRGSSWPTRPINCRSAELPRQC